MKLLLLWLTARLPVEEISHQGVKFMERYYVGTLLGWRFYIHRFIGSDPDGVHDHPWRYGVSLILCGGYLEQKRDGVHPRLWFNLVNGDTFHRVIMPHGWEAWTLFAHDGRCKPWGFMRWHGAVCYEDRWADVFVYKPIQTQPGHSTWHLTAPKGRDISRAL